MSNEQCDEPLPDGGNCQYKKAVGAVMCGEHLMKWIQRLTEALRRDHNLIYAMLLKHDYLQRELDFWPAFYGGGGLMNASEDRLKEFARAGDTP